MADTEAPPLKKQCVAREFTMNINEAIVVSNETKYLTEMVEMDASALQGIGPKAVGHLKNLGITTIRDLANWKYQKWAEAIVTMAATENHEGDQHEDRRVGSKMNLNHGLDKEFETKSLREVCSAPSTCLQGLADSKIADLEFLHIETVEKLAAFKYSKWAKAMLVLAELENTDLENSR